MASFVFFFLFLVWDQLHLQRFTGDRLSWLNWPRLEAKCHRIYPINTRSLQAVGLYCAFK